LSDAVTIERGPLKARIRAQGAELTSLSDDGRELIWQADPKVWGWHAPNLFPIVGALDGDRLIHHGRQYALPPHGFLRRTDCTLVMAGADRCHWRLTENAATLAAYPFRFQLDFDYVLEPEALAATVTLGNPGDETLVASFGLHPAFNWPLSPDGRRADHRLVFEQEETAPIRRLAGKLLGRAAYPSPVSGRKLLLHDGLFAEDAIIMDAPASSAVAFGASDGPAVELSWQGFSQLGIWTKPGAPFLCIEPWQGFASPEGFAGDFAEKPGTIALQPGERRHWRYRIRPLAHLPNLIR
jgi:galactose mutarotase-like enzyme